MFMSVSSVTQQGYDVFALSTKKKIINTDQIVSITIYCSNPKMIKPEHREKIEKIFDTKFDNLVVFKIDFSNQTYDFVIGPKNKFDSIK